MADKPPAGKKRGRPKGSKTKPKPAADLPLEQLADAAAGAAQGPGAETPPGDTPPGRESPGGKGKRRSRVTKKGTQQIEDALAEILQIPAVPAAMLGDVWMADHFTAQGRQLANRIAIVSERNPVLRAWCERALEGESIAVLLMAGLMYAAPPLMHFGLVPGGEFIGVPVLRRQAAQPADPGPVPAAAPAREPVPAKPYGGEPVSAEDEADTGVNTAERVDPDAHFVGGANGDGPPLWTEQMMSG
jgi:hypothetical protein